MRGGVRTRGSGAALNSLTARLRYTMDRDPGQSSLMLATVSQREELSFTARDVEGLSTGDPATFTAALYRCSTAGGRCTFATTLPIKSRGFGHYVVQVRLTSLGSYRVDLALDGTPLNLTDGLRIEGACPPHSFAFDGSCESCPPSVGCGAALNPAAGVTVESLELRPNHWRLSNRSTRIYTCVTDRSRPSSCVGGRNASLYCANGTAGPLCSVCALPQHHLNQRRAACEPCHASRASAVLAVVGQALAGLLCLAALLTALGSAGSSRWGRRAAVFCSRLGLRAKAKAVVGYFQVVLLIPRVFDVTLPEWYDRLMQPFHVFAFDWQSVLAVPSVCFGSFATQVVVEVALLPVAFIAAVNLAMLTAHAPSSAAGLAKAAEWQRGARAGFLAALPTSLMIIFAMLPQMSARVFSAFSCDGFEEYAGQTRYYVHDDRSLECSSEVADYRHLTTLALVFIVLFPVGVPLLLALLLRVSHSSPPRQWRSQLARATSFLWEDYRDGSHQWEVAETARKLTVSGFLLLIPQRLSLVRLLAALLLSIGFVFVLQEGQLQPNLRPASAAAQPPLLPNLRLSDGGRGPFLLTQHPDEARC